MKTEMRTKTAFARCLSARIALAAAAVCGWSAVGANAHAMPSDNEAAPPDPEPSPDREPRARTDGTAVHDRYLRRPERNAGDHERDRTEAPVQERFLHGFRVGYAYVANYEKPIVAFQSQTTNSDGTVTTTSESLKERVHMRTPHQFLIGYEGMYRMVGHSWLNVILVGNVLVGGLEQSQFYPTANTILGFEFNNSFQLGVGANMAPLKDNIAHVVIAGGWTPRVGSFYVPVHAFFIPDVDGVHRMGMTTGVTW